MLGESHYTLVYHKRTLYNKTNNSTEKKILLGTFW